MPSAAALCTAGYSAFMDQFDSQRPWSPDRQPESSTPIYDRLLAEWRDGSRDSVRDTPAPLEPGRWNAFVPAARPAREIFSVLVLPRNPAEAHSNVVDIAPDSTRLSGVAELKRPIAVIQCVPQRDAVKGEA